MRTRTLSVSAIVAVATLCFAVAAGAASPLGEVTVSNPSPRRAGDIQVASTGWQPGGVVSILLTGTDGVLAHASSDATGAVHVRVAIPADAALGRQVLSVVGSTAGGFPQQITSVIVVAGSARPSRPARPWTIVFVLAAVATVLMLLSVRSERQLAIANP
ncbi:MAG: hypothetical protein ACLPVY_04555 [Acidimicrobiia bacterium]